MYNADKLQLVFIPWLFSASMTADTSEKKHCGHWLTVRHSRKNSKNRTQNNLDILS